MSHSGEAKGPGDQESAVTRRLGLVPGQLEAEDQSQACHHGSVRLNLTTSCSVRMVLSGAELLREEPMGVIWLPGREPGGWGIVSGRESRRLVFSGVCESRSF